MVSPTLGGCFPTNHPPAHCKGKGEGLSVIKVVVVVLNKMEKLK